MLRRGNRLFTVTAVAGGVTPVPCVGSVASKQTRVVRYARFDSCSRKIACTLGLASKVLVDKVTLLIRIARIDLGTVLW